MCAAEEGVAARGGKEEMWKRGLAGGGEEGDGGANDERRAQHSESAR